jgi:hypothetical protein
MATFDRKDAEIKQVFLRRPLPGGGQAYDRLPYNIVTYDDGTGGIEGVCDPHLSDMTHGDAGGVGTRGEPFIIDRPPYSGINEIK